VLRLAAAARLVTPVFALLAMAIRAGALASAAEPPAVASIQTLRPSGGQVDWSPSENLIAYDALSGHQRYDVRVMAPDGTGDRCLTCDLRSLAPGHKGSPAWHPGGKWIAFLAEKRKHPGSSYEALPGFGQFCDLWVVSADGERAFSLTDLPAQRGQGVLMPHFSRDGRSLSWTQMKAAPRLLDLKKRQTLGYWTLRTARFEETEAGPRLADVRTYEPTPDAFYENDGFTPDGKGLAFTGSPHGGSVWESHLYLLDLDKGGITAQLTDALYNEHAVYSPDGRQILWMTNLGNGPKGATDWWIMQADGSGKRRLTYFNERGHPHYRGKVWATDASWSPDGKAFVGYVQESLISQKGEIVLVTLR